MNWENFWTICGSTFYYCILTLWIPSLCFGRYVKKKNLTFRFFFYQCTGNLYITFVVWGLGLCHGVHFATLLLTLIILPLFWCYLQNRQMLRKKWRMAKSVLSMLTHRTYGKHVLGREIIDTCRKKRKSFYIKHIKGRETELLVSGLVMVWVVWFYGWYKFHNVAYAHTDEETHLYWISELLHGNIFPAGIYPHGMHTLVAAIAGLSGMTIYRVYIMFSVMSAALVFASAYLFIRKCFTNSYVALAGWIFFVFTDIFQPVSYFRFQISFPMEFGLVAAFGLLSALIEYIKSKEKADLILFSLCITWTLMAHFYVTIFCAVICVCFGVVYLYILFKKKVLIQLVLGGITGIILACVPYAMGYALGYSFERSIGWALGISSTTSETDAEKEEEETPKEQEIPENASVFEKEMVYLTKNFVREKEAAKVLLIANKVFLMYGLLGILFAKRKEVFMRYLFLAVLWEAGAILACTYYLNTITLIEVKRMATFLTFLTIPVFCMPFDMLYRFLKCLKCRRNRIQWILAALTVGEIVVLFLTGNKKEKKDLYYEIIATEADVKTCLELLENGKKHTWTVISPTNDLSIIRYDGYHYEITDLVRELDGGEEEIYIPTEEIYVISEKKAISFLSAKRKIDRSDVAADKYVKKISAELALSDVDWELEQDEIHSLDAPYYFQRETLMSKLHYWIWAVSLIYPNHVSVFYEDEQVCVYKIEQDPYFMLNLSVDYKILANEELWGKDNEKNTYGYTCVQ